MRKFTTEHTVYDFDELSSEARQKAVEALYDLNVDFDWWDGIYDDANTIGLKITSFDLYRHDITGNLTEDMPTVCKLIMENHGETTSTYLLAKRNQHKHGEDNEETFLKELLEEYLSILQDDYDYLTSEEAIIEAIKANEYEFYEDGELA